MSASTGRWRKCSVCGQVGHQKNSKDCPGKLTGEDTSGQGGGNLDASLCSTEHVTIPKKLDRLWEIVTKLVKAPEEEPTPVKAQGVGEPLAGPSTSSPAERDGAAKPSPQSPQTPSSRLATFLQNGPQGPRNALLKQLWKEVTGLLKLDASVGHSSVDLAYLKDKGGKSLADVTARVSSALSTFTGLLGKKRRGHLVGELREEIQKLARECEAIGIEQMTVSDSVASHVLRSIYPQFLFIETLSRIDLKTEYQIYSVVAILLYGILSFNSCGDFCLTTVAEPFEEGSRLLLDHEFWVAGKLSKGPIEFVEVRQRPGPVKYPCAVEIKVAEGDLASSLPQAIAEGIALIETNRGNGAYDADEPQSATILLTTLKVWLGLFITAINLEPGNIRLHVSFGGPFQFYDTVDNILFDEAEDVVKLLIQAFLPHMVSTPLEVWVENGERFKAKTQSEAEAQFNERALRAQLVNERVLSLERDNAQLRADLARTKKELNEMQVNRKRSRT